MKEKTSITLSREVLSGVDRLAGSRGSRSATIERILHNYLKQQARLLAHAQDVRKINRSSDELNAEALDVLDYQATESDGSL